MSGFRQFSGTRVERSLMEAGGGSRVTSEVFMAMKPYADVLKAAFQREYESFVQYMLYAGDAWRSQALALAKATKAKPSARTLIIAGERACPADRNPATNEQYLAILEATRRLEGTPFHILFSGGVLGLETLTGDVPAQTMADEFNVFTGQHWRDQMSIDQMSENTGEQARIIGGMIRAKRYERIVIVLPVEHAGRFAATLAFDLYERRVQGGPVLFPVMYFFSFGTWDEIIVQRGLTRAQEAFGPVEKAIEARLVSKPIGGEFSERYPAEMNPATNAGYACPALPPSEMLLHFMPYAV